jgi:hypothetical protein
LISLLKNQARPSCPNWRPNFLRGQPYRVMPSERGGAS